MPTSAFNATLVVPLLDGRYRLHDVLGQGGHGTVYRATDERLEREVAVKLLDRGAPGARERFELEVRAVAAVGHPGLVPVFDIGVTPEGFPFLVMERQRGETLEQRIQRDGPLGLTQALDVVLDVGEALEAAHAAGLLHRDIKPANVMLSLMAHGRIKGRLLDFGLAILTEADERLTAAGVIVGSPAYVPPERLRGVAPEVRGDVYGLALVLYEALAGRPAFDAPSPVALRAKILTAEPLPLERSRDDVPGDVLAAVKRALAKEPSARFPSVQSFLDALRVARDLLSGPSAVVPPPPLRPAEEAQTRETQAHGSPRAPLNTLPPGTTVGGYRLVRPLGSGGMAVVYEAIDAALGRKVAIKLPRGGVDVDRLAFARLEREARAAASLGHPNVVGVHDVGIDPAHGAYLVMELLNGEPLSDRIRRKGALPAAETIEIALEVLDGLAAAHAAGMIHRDVKPANVLLVPLASGGHLVKILDFGIVKLREEAESPKLTHRGAAIGTPAYMAPEQLRMEVVDARADVYAVGTTIYEMLTGQLAPRGETAPLGPDAQRGSDADLSALTDPRIRSIVERAMAREPEQRYPHAAAMRDALALLHSTALGRTLLFTGQPAVAEIKPALPPTSVKATPRVETPLPVAPSHPVVATPVAETPRSGPAVPRSTGVASSRRGSWLILGLACSIALASVAAAMFRYLPALDGASVEGPGDVRSGVEPAEAPAVSEAPSTGEPSTENVALSAPVVVPVMPEAAASAPGAGESDEDPEPREGTHSPRVEPPSTRPLRGPRPVTEATPAEGPAVPEPEEEAMPGILDPFHTGP